METIRAWGKLKAVAAYSGVSERTVEEWLKNGLRCSRLPSGLRLIKFQWVDEFLGRFTRDLGDQVDQIANEVIEKIS